jgi:hypothetical protein
MQQTTLSEIIQLRRIAIKAKDMQAYLREEMKTNPGRAFWVDKVNATIWLNCSDEVLHYYHFNNLIKSRSCKAGLARQYDLFSIKAPQLW